MNEPNALRLAKWLDAMPSSGYALSNQAATELRRLHEEVNEQARLLGMSAERELALLAKIDRLDRQLGEAVWNYGEKVRVNQELLEALKLALDALEAVTKEMLAIRDEIAERGGRPKTNAFHQRLWDSSFAAYTDKAIPTAEAIREALAEQTAQDQGQSCYCSECERLSKELDAIKAQQQEPVKVGRVAANVKDMVLRQEVMLYTEDYLPIGTALYTSPPASKPLTDEEIKELYGDDDNFRMTKKYVVAFARAIEAAHGIKGET